MTGSTARVEVLRDAEATLRLVEAALAQLSDDGESAATALPPAGEAAASVPDLSGVSDVLLGVYGEIVAVLERLRSGQEDASRQLAFVLPALVDLEERLYGVVSVVSPPESRAAKEVVAPATSKLAAQGPLRITDLSGPT